MARRCSGCASKISASFSHKDGISPAWPLGYDVFEPYYAEAEALFHVHGQRGEDPTEPWSSTPYAYPPVQHEPRIQQLSDSLSGQGLHPFHLPLGIKLDQNPDGSADHVQPLHTLRRLRRLPLRHQRQSRRAGDLRRSGAGRASQLHPADPRHGDPAGDRRRRPQRQRACT